MKMLNMILLAGSALVPAAATAQTAAPPVRFEDTPAARLNVPAQPRLAPRAAPAPGVTWQRNAPVIRSETRTAAPPQVEMRPAQTRSAEGSYVVQHRSHMRDHRNGPPRHARINKGGSVHSYWFGPRFVIGDWNRYGFSQPFDGGRWIRYYDDALLIDRDGRVRDGRYGMDWDRYGERWSSDDRGVPGYDRDDEYDDRDDYDDRYAKDDRGYEHYGYDDGDYDRDEGVSHHGESYRHDERVTHGGASYGYPGYGYYGYGYGPVVTITETTVTEPATATAHTYYDYVPAKPHRKAKHKARCHCPPAHAATPHHAPRPVPKPAPRPRYDGERG